MGIKSGHIPPYVNKLARSAFRQVKGLELAILASAYYTGRAHSILGRNFENCPPPPFWSIFAVHVRGYAILLKIEVIFFKFFFQKCVLGSPDNTLSNF